MNDSTVYRLPPRARTPAPLGALYFAIGEPRSRSRFRRRHGPAVRLRIPGLGEGVIVYEPELIKQVFTAKPEVMAGGGDFHPLSRTLGPRSMFALDGDEHLRQRRLLLPPFHGERMGDYASVFEEEALNELTSWPQDTELPAFGGMMRITLNAILRTVFGAEGAELDELRAFMPAWVKLGSLLTAAPPWLQRDLGRWSPWGRFLSYRRRYDAILDRLIAGHRADPDLAERGDVLALLLRARYEDGTEMTREEMSDQLLTLLVAGHETTAGTLAWAVERLRRHPQFIRRLEQEIEAGGKELREATIFEVQRSRSVIGGAMRRVKQPFELGEWLLPPGMIVVVDSLAVHSDPAIFPAPERFEPDRFLNAKPDTYSWLPFGGGRRRCIGAAFAHLEMDVVLRTLIEHFELLPTSERSERWRYRGVAFVPSRGGMARVRRRAEPLRARAQTRESESVPA